MKSSSDIDIKQETKELSEKIPFESLSAEMKGLLTRYICRADKSYWDFVSVKDQKRIIKQGTLEIVRLFGHSYHTSHPWLF